MKIRFYLDEDAMYNSLTQELRIRGVDTLTALDASMIEKPDHLHLSFAASQNRVLFSFNVGDFHQIHNEFLAEGKEHSGILLSMQQRYSIGEQLRRMMRFISLVRAEEMKNKMEFLSSWG